MGLSSIELVKIISKALENTSAFRVWGFVHKEDRKGAWWVERTGADTSGDYIIYASFDGTQWGFTNVGGGGDLGFKNELLFYRKKSDGTEKYERIAGFGSFGWNDYPTSSMIFRFKDDGTFDVKYSTESEVGNPNNDNNLDTCLYHVPTRKLFCGTAQGGRFIRRIDIETLDYEKSVKCHSLIDSSISYGHQAHILAAQSYIYILSYHNKPATFNASKTMLRVARVTLDDFINEFDNVNAFDEMDSYEVIYENSNVLVMDAPGLKANIGGKMIILITNTDASNPRYAILDIINGTLTELSTPTAPPPNDRQNNGYYIARILNYFAVIGNDGKLYILDTSGNIITSVDIENFSNYNNNGEVTIGFWSNRLIGVDNVSKEVHVFNYKINLKTPSLQLDVVNKKIKVIDIESGNPIQGAEISIWKHVIGSNFARPVDISAITKTTDSNGEADISDILEAGKFISFELTDLPEVAVT